ncbi:hypothetical protein BASA81_004226 [Batrachochytrium salamandrivorans]|nr:hypothetical protein BASA81_004226 [Batrachochytrium salamandrivorans]
MTRLLLLLAAATAAVVVLAPFPVLGEDYCSQLAVPPCPAKLPRDVLFLVDGSNSMSESRFYKEMLDYTLGLFCALEPSLPNQAGMIIFNQQVQEAIPLSAYSREGWKNQVETVRENRGNLYSACCSCCTPLAETFLLAGEHFRSRQKNAIRIAFVITDGVPSNNYYNAYGGNPLWWFNAATKDFNPAKYNTDIVPQAANVLKAAGHRIMLVGIPGKTALNVDSKYFNGQYADKYNYCVTRDLVKYCSPYVRKDMFPIVSLPFKENSFVSSTWNVDALVSQTVSALCQLPPTTAPTRVPTQSPTTSLPTQSPTKRPTAQPTLAPTLRPTTAGPTLAPTSQKPTKSPTKVPTLKPTTLAPTFAPSQSPTMLVMEQVDVTFLMDRSNSMNWLNGTCQKVIDSIGQHLKTLGNETQIKPTQSMCWELFLRYVLTQSDAVAKIMAGTLQNRTLGWNSDFKGVSYPMKGLRVNVIGFACENNQRTPKVYSFSDSIMGGPITNREDLVLLLEELRTSVMPAGGTCPGLAIEYLVKTVEAQSAAQYPLQTVVLLTDGVFYDGSAPEKATEGLEAYKVLRFAVGIAIASSEHAYGLSVADIKTQQTQLSKFVGNQPSLFKDLGSAGYFALLDVAGNIASDLKDYYYYNSKGAPIPRYTWCGFRRRNNCESNNWRQQACYWPKSSVSEYGCATKPQG